MMISEIERKCIVCGNQLKIRLMENREYSGAHYFGRIEVPVGEGENKIIGKTRIMDLEMRIFEWTGEYIEEEYWECDKCFQKE